MTTVHAEPASGAPARSDLARILLVEDNPLDVRRMPEALKGCRVATKLDVAADGVQALDYLRAAADLSAGWRVPTWMTVAVERPSPGLIVAGVLGIGAAVNRLSPRSVRLTPNCPAERSHPGSRPLGQRSSYGTTVICLWRRSQGHVSSCWQSVA